MQLLTINAGGSSVRLDVFSFDPSTNAITPVTSKHCTTTDVDPSELLHSVVPPSSSSSSSSSSPIFAVFHRIVHGGPHFHRPTVIDASTLSTLTSLSSLDPLHNPPALSWIRSAQRAFPFARQVATFDTAFFTDLPLVARTLPLPYALEQKHRLRRYGFHGMAHHSMWQQFSALRPDLPKGGRLLTLQLGSGCSVTALREGKPVDTSMGFGPLEGLMMTTRTGNLDPAVVTFLQRVEPMTADDMEAMLYNKSGLLGVSEGESKDMGELLKSQTERGKLAVDMFCYAAKKYLGAYAAVLGGLDGVVFGGGMGEKGKEVRRRVCEGLQWMGIELDEEVNAKTEKTARISKKGAKVDVWVVSVDEAKVMVEEGRHLLGKDSKQSSQ